MDNLKCLALVILSVIAFVFCMREISAKLHDCSAFSKESCDWDDQQINPYF